MQLPYEWNMDGTLLAPHALERVRELLASLPANVSLKDDLSTFLSVLLYDGEASGGWFDRISPRRDLDDVLTPYAVAQLDAWDSLLESLNACFAAGAAFVVLGVVCNLGLLASYRHSQVMASSVESPLLADDPLSASLVALLALVNGAAFNALTQVI